MFNDKILKRVTTDFGHSLTFNPEYVAEFTSLKNSDAAKNAVFLLTNPKRKLDSFYKKSGSHIKNSMVLLLVPPH